MDNHEFNFHTELLREAIARNPDNTELLNKYADLITLKLEHDKELYKLDTERNIKQSEANAQLQSTIHTNNTNLWINANNNNAMTQQNYYNNYALMNNHYLSQQAVATKNLIANPLYTTSHTSNQPVLSYNPANLTIDQEEQ